MLTEEKLKEIRHRLDQAQFGYGRIGGPEYCSDVTALLNEIERLRELEAKISSSETTKLNNR